MTKNNLNATFNPVMTLLCDFYKTSHRAQYPENTEYIYSTLTPRSNKYAPHINKIVAFSFLGFAKKYLVEYFDEFFFERPKEEVVSEYERLIKYALGDSNPDSSHIAALHDLGYLPIRLRALKEGTLVPMKIPVMSIENTHPDFFWLTNYLETIISTETWQPMTSATIANEYRKILEKYAKKTTGSIEGVDYQAHDFSMRGMSSLESAILSSAGHMTSFVGCETIPAIFYLEHYYGANIEKEIVGSGISATEHSVMSASTSADGERNEYETFKRLITEVYPSGFVSIVSDTYDFWKNIEEVLPKLKDTIMARDGKTIIRPDSGDPVDIICGKEIVDLTDDPYVDSLEDAKFSMMGIMEDKVRDETPHGEHGESNPAQEFKYKGKYYRLSLSIFWNRHDKQYYYIDECDIEACEEFTPAFEDLGLIESLWNIFGGTVTEQGYKMLDSHIGAIYGDSINLERAELILSGLEKKGFASTNVVLGVGSFSYQFNTRDTFGFAIKATHAIIDGEERLLFKDPKTDDGTKRSQRGKVAVIKVGDKLVCEDGLTNHTYEANFAHIDQLEDVFVDGKIVREETLAEIRQRLADQRLR